MAKKKEISGKKMKKVKMLIAICVMALIILILLLVISRVHSKERILNNLLAGMNHLNYSYIAEDGKTIVNVVGKYEKRTNADVNYITYVDYETKKSIDAYIEEGYKEEYSNEGIEAMPYYQQFIKNYFESNAYDYKYIGRRHENEKDYIVIQFKDKIEVDERRAITRLWIEATSYLIEKEAFLVDYQDQEVLVSENTYSYYTNENTLTDVKVPDTVLTGCSDNTNG